ncbi:MAG: PQQ-dependent sugar dehydrogenase, partial [Thermoleophilia bacterium]|nr:PQQ-dependent sugar dehydrogenase [Thermoleophilia bacterium]
MLSPAGAGALSLEQVGDFDFPTYVTSDPSDPDRLFVVERSGRIQLVENGKTSLFLDIESIVLSPLDDGPDGDTGLFSMTFSPEFETDSLFYVTYSSADDPGTEDVDESGEWHLAEFTAAGDSASPASRREVLAVELPPDQTYLIHHAGQLQFGPDDGYLYASTGDGGPQGDPYGNAQNLNSLLGKMIRIDPQPESGGAYGIPADNPFVAAFGEDEIWSYGLRNPWRFSFDRLTGDLVIGDVGYLTWEEVNFAAAPDPGKGANFGWNCREGTHLFSATPPCDDPQTFTDPVFEYEHVGGNCSVTGGYVVRDPALGDLYGRYLYADWCVGELRSLALGPPVLDRSEGLCVEFPTSFGEDSLGRIYVASLEGPVYRITAGGSSGACATDTTPPDTTIDSGPTGTINTDQATFTFSGTPAGDTAKVQCKIDSDTDTFADCTSPKTFTGLSDGPHTASFRAEDGAGNWDPSPAARTFTVDTTVDPPVVDPPVVDSPVDPTVDPPVVDPPVVDPPVVDSPVDPTV